MADTVFTTDDALTKKAWEEKLYRDQKKESYFAKFMGTSSDSLIQEKTQLTKEKGDKITFGIRMRLSGAGVEDDQTLEGKAEALTTYDYSVTLKLYRHAVSEGTVMSQQRAMFSIGEEARTAIKDWGAEKMDQNVFDALLSSPTKIFYKTSAGVLATGTAATAKTALTAANGKLTPEMISYMKAWAMTGGARSYVPLRPVKVNGRKYLVLLVHPDVMYDLKNDSTFTQAMREAEVRGPENPLFQGATAIWDGMVVHEHENISIATDAGAGSDVAWAHCKLMGAQAGVLAWGKRPWEVTEEFDFKNRTEHAWNMISRAGKPQFNSKDYGSVSVYLARTNVSGS